MGDGLIKHRRRSRTQAVYLCLPNSGLAYPDLGANVNIRREFLISAATPGEGFASLRGQTGANLSDRRKSQTLKSLTVIN